jgi:hypothetical protein
VLLLVGGRVSAKEFYSDGNIMAGDNWPSASIYDTPPNHTTVNMSGGQVTSISTYDTSILNITGGILNNLYSFEFSTANISGNDSGSRLDIQAGDNSIVNFSGTIYSSYIYAVNSATINITGGTIGDLNAYNSGVINIYAGNISNAWAQDSAYINIYGQELIKIATEGAFGHGFVHGHYNNGTTFYFDLMSSETYSHVNLIPEPVTILLLGAGGLFLRKKD